MSIVPVIYIYIYINEMGPINDNNKSINSNMLVGISNGLYCVVTL